MWVASIENGQNGACVIQYPHFLDDAAETLGGSFYVLPSSIHEVLLLADDTSPSLSELENMVRTINQAEVAPEERLSDNVFHYDCESHISKTHVPLKHVCRLWSSLLQTQSCSRLRSLTP